MFTITHSSTEYNVWFLPMLAYRLNLHFIQYYFLNTFFHHWLFKCVPFWSNLSCHLHSLTRPYCSQLLLYQHHSTCWSSLPSVTLSLSIHSLSFVYTTFYVILTLIKWVSWHPVLCTPNSSTYKQHAPGKRLK